jgi:hypothetical protein
MDAAGNAIAVWMQFDGPRSDIWANRYSASTGAWGTATLIESNDGGSAFFPVIAVSRGGNAMVVWTQLESGAEALKANNYSAGQWGQAIDMGVSGSISRPKVAMDTTGNAIAVWMQHDSTSQLDLAMSRRYKSTGTWEPIVVLQSIDILNAFSPTISFNRDGNAIAAWLQFDNAPVRSSSIWTRFYSADNGWRVNGVLVKDSSTTTAVVNPHITLTDSNTAVAVWQQFNGTYYSVTANHLNLDTNQWGTATQVVTAAPGSTDNVRVARGGGGDVFAVWSQLDGARRDVWTSRYRQDGVGGVSWSTTQLLETNNTGNANTPHIATDSVGNAIAVWSQTVGTLTRIWANIFITDRQ